ncbi:MAG: ArnT family glycosyltransferase, partial [Actinomycetes bacterium]
MRKDPTSTTDAGRTTSARWFGRWLLIPLVIGAALRIAPTAAHLPEVRHPDEPINFDVLHQMVAHRTGVPRVFWYPTTFYYVHIAAQLPAALLARATGRVDALADYGRSSNQWAGNAKVEHRSAMLLGRLVNVLAGLALIAATAWTAHQATRDRRVVLLSAWLAAISPLLVIDAGRFTPDTLSGLVATLAVGTALRVGRRPDVWSYGLAGVAIGIAFTTKYNAALCGIVLVVMWLTDHRRTARQAAVAAGSALLAAIVVMPTIIVTPDAVIGGLRFNVDHYRTGHAGNEGNSWTFNLWWIVRNLGLFGLVAPLGPLLRRQRETIALGVYAASGYVVLSTPSVRFERNILPVLPAVIVLSAVATVALGVRWKAHPFARRAVEVAAAASMVLMLVLSLAAVARAVDDHDHRAVDEYVASRLPQGGTVQVEAYSPELHVPQ